MSKRKMLAVKEEIANKIVELAYQRGITVYQTINDILEQALRAEDSGSSVKELVGEKWMLERARELGFSFTLEHLFYQTVDVAYMEVSDKISQLWRDMGHWYGKYFESKNNDPFRAFAEAMELLTLGTSEFALEKGRNGELSVSCFGERYSLGFTEVFSLFIEEVFEVLGYSVSKKILSKGIINMCLEKPDEVVEQ